MRKLLIVERPKQWAVAIGKVEDVEVVPARQYLTDPVYAERRTSKVFNLCSSYSYQSLGYYVSLLAEARSHRCLPTLATIQSLKQRSLPRSAANEMERQMRQCFRRVDAPECTLAIVFGKSLDGSHPEIAKMLFRLFPAPFLQATFTRHPKSGEWSLTSLRPEPDELEDAGRQAQFHELLVSYFRRPNGSGTKRPEASFDIAILYNPQEAESPSNPRAIRHFIKAAETVGLRAECIEREDYRRLPSFDALFIRETTSVHHHTYRFAQLAAAEGLVVIDDPASILRCTNKVYLAEVLKGHGIPTPDTLVLDGANPRRVVAELGFPCVLKVPDSSFSQGVVKVESESAFKEVAKRMFARSDLFVAQRYVPTDFDWRVTIFDRKPLFACRYYMARHHWQVIKRSGSGKKLRDGNADTLAIADAPPKIVEAAVQAANLIGDGLYGVDVKEVDGKPLVIEVNDNPNIDAGIEDAVLGMELYRLLMEGFLRRIERLRGLEKRP